MTLWLFLEYALVLIRLTEVQCSDLVMLPCNDVSLSKQEFYSSFCFIQETLGLLSLFVRRPWSILMSFRLRQSSLERLSKDQPHLGKFERHFMRCIRYITEIGHMPVENTQLNFYLYLAISSQGREVTRFVLYPCQRVSLCFVVFYVWV